MNCLFAPAYLQLIGNHGSFEITESEWRAAITWAMELAWEAPDDVDEWKHPVDGFEIEPADARYLGSSLQDADWKSLPGNARWEERHDVDYPYSVFCGPTKQNVPKLIRFLISSGGFVIKTEQTR